jgi:hypothetical protein
LLALLTHRLAVSLAFRRILLIEATHLLHLLGAQVKLFGHPARLLGSHLLGRGTAATSLLGVVLSHSLNSGHQEDGSKPNHSTVFHRYKELKGC